MHVAAHLVGAWPMTSLRFWQLVYAFALLLSFFCLTPAFAATWRDGGGWAPANVSQGNDGAFSVLPDTRSPNNTHVTTCTPQLCTRTGDLPAPIGKGNPRLKPSASFPKINIATGALALGSRLSPYLIAGKALYDWYEAANVRPDGDGEGFESLDGGQSTVSNYYCRDGQHGGCDLPFPQGRFADEASALSFTAPSTLPYYGSTVSKCNAPVVSQSTPTYQDWRQSYCTSAGAFAQVVTFRIRKVSEVACQSSGSVLGYPLGGLCPQGQWQPVDESQARIKLQYAPVTPEVLSRALEEVLKAGGAIQDTGTHSVTGPASVPGETRTKTTTAPNGTTQVVTTTNTHNYTYNDNRVTITTTTTTQNPDGSTESETTDAPEVDACTRDPLSLACVKLGDLPSDSPAWETKTIAYQADSLGLPAACPAPWTGQLRGWTLSFSYQPACDVAPQVRLAILALTTLGALLMIITTVRT